MQQRRALGRGLDSLISSGLPPQGAEPTAAVSSAYRLVPIESVAANRAQPRTVFDEESLRELADSIREQGILQPLIVTALPDGRYELIAGERRLRASRIAGLSEVPVIVKDADNEQVLALAILENIQREDLNAIEEARAYQELINQFGYTQEDVAQKLGKARVSVTNSLRLLKLPRVIQNDVVEGRYSAAHARAILALDNVHEQMKMREYILKMMPTVRDVEQMVQNRSQSGRVKAGRNQASLPPQMASIVNKMKQSLGTKVHLRQGKNGGGQIVIDFYSVQDLDRLYQKFVS